MQLQIQGPTDYRFKVRYCSKVHNPITLLWMKEWSQKNFNNSEGIFKSHFWGNIFFINRKYLVLNFRKIVKVPKTLYPENLSNQVTVMYQIR